MVKFLTDLIEGGFVGQAVIATMVTGVIVYAVIADKTVPQFIVAAWGMIVGWYFRSQAQMIADRRAKNKGWY